MCGIAGQYDFRNGLQVSRHRIEAMTRAIAHRGPDDEGFHFSPGLGLGFRRLSIIDLAGGHQPMADSSGAVWVVFNGEIYNFRTLRQELEARGHVFRTRSDTEVIVHGYREWGTAVLERLEGMFGLAIWDRERRRLVLARDAMGIKLVYYRVANGIVTFGSELRAVLAGDNAIPEIDPEAVSLFLRYRFTPSPLTLYRGIFKLAPGTLAVFEGGDWEVQRWYHGLKAETRAVAPRQAEEELVERYRLALERHLVSDVPVGLLLSGGMDSALLLALMNTHGSGWPTYTVGYGREAYADDELADAADTARALHAPNVQVRLDRRTFEQALPRIVACLEEPVAASSIVPMYFVCERARRDVKVALVGQGPDELFGGYTRHLGVRYGDYWRRTPQWLRRSMEAGVRRLPRSETFKRGVHALGTQARLARYRDVLSLMPGQEIAALFRPGVLAAASADMPDAWLELESQMDGTDELNGFQTLELGSTLPDELLLYADKLSMAHGLEVRVPYLDRELVEYARALPQALKVRNGQCKWLHRRVCARFLPPAILNRPKRGFGVNVVDRWFRESLDGKLSEYLVDGDALMYQFLDPLAVRALVGAHRAGRADHHKLLFSLVVLEQWLRGQRGPDVVRARGPVLERRASTARGMRLEQARGI